MVQTYDAVVVGSGAAGGISAYVLTKAGLKVLMLEAGRSYDPRTETAMFNLPPEAPLHGASTPDKQAGYYDATIDGGAEIPGEPYTNAQDSQGPFWWWRARMLGGRTNHWGRLSLRYGPYDFKPYSRDGLGVDWPMTYQDLAPWYDEVERFIGVAGANEGYENVPVSSPGVLLPPFPLRASEYFFKRCFEKLGMPVAAARLAILTQPHNGRPPCLYATDCMRGCAIGANFQSTTVAIPPALETGNLQIRTNAVVYEVALDRRGLASGVKYLDRKTGAHHSVQAKTVVLAASALESARILLNSKSALFPQGLANENGQVGRNLMDTVSVMTMAQIPALEKLPPRNDDGASIFHMYVPWWGYGQQARKELDFPRGYHIQPYGNVSMPSMGGGIAGLASKIADCEAPYGASLRAEMRRKYASYFAFYGIGEMIPNEKTYVDMDPEVKDQWGIPVLRFHWRWSEHELRQANHQRRTYREIIELAGGRVVYEREPPIGHIHEAGTTRMGFSARDSVVNSFGQSWSVRNLFVVDGGIFASHPRSPTLTIMALAWRNSAYLAEQARKRNL